MKTTTAASAPPEEWTLIRGARQLLTLRGSSGPRRGSAMNELNVIHDGSLLLRNGVIHECGLSRRVENLAAARKAREISATGKVVMPAFVDPDGVLVFPPPALHRDSNLQVMSRRLLESGAGNFAAEWTRGGTLTLGAHTAVATSLKDTVKILRVHGSLQGKPLRIRSIVSARPTPEQASLDFVKALDEQWLPAIHRRKLASVVEFTLSQETAGLTGEQIRAASVVAANHGFSIRIRCEQPPDGDLCAMSREAGAIAMIGMPPAAAIGGVCVISGAYALAAKTSHERAIRAAIDAGMAIAVGSGYPRAGLRSSNPQYLLYLAMEQYGLSCEEAIMASTYNAACSLKMSHVTGSLEPGKSGDIVVMDVPDYRELSRRVGHSDVLQVMRGGQTVYRRGQVGVVGTDLA